MNPRDEAASSPDSALREALVAYHRSRARPSVASREPALLFASINHVLQLAIARDAGSGMQTHTASASVTQAARHFVRTALLMPDADHYTLLGLAQGADPADLKGRYRLLMRLLHPDFSDTSNWPKDAAGRVNRAYEVLSSAQKRLAYDATRPEPVPPLQARQPNPQGPGPQTHSPAPKQTAWNSLHLKRATLLGSFAMAMVFMAVLFIGNQAPLVEIVQRASQPTRTAVRAADRESLRQPALEVVGGGATAVAPPEMLALRVPAPTHTHTVTPPLAVQQDAPASIAKRQAMSEKPTGLLQPTPAAAPAPVTSVVATDAPGVLAAAVASPIVVPAPMPSRGAELAVVVPVPATTPPPVLAPSMADAHPLLAQLLQMMESGTAERLLNVLEPAARQSPSAQAIVRQYSNFLDGARPVKLSQVQFRGESREGRLLVNGQVTVQAGDLSDSAVGKPFSMQAEFALKEGKTVMTRLTRSQN